MTRPIGRNRLKREYARARDVYRTPARDLHDLRNLAERLPIGILDPAIDHLQDLMDAAEIPYRAALVQCVERGITTAYGYHIKKHELDNEADYEDGDR